MEDRVRRVGKEFLPVGFETSGASTSQCSTLLKRLSEIAHQRGAPQGVLHPPVEGDAGDDFGEEGRRGGFAEGVQGAAGAAPASRGRGGGRGFGTAA